MMELDTNIRYCVVMYSLNSKQLSFRWLSADKNCNQPYGRLVFEVSKALFYSTTTATPTDSHTAPALPIYIRKRRRLHLTCSYSQARATVESGTAASVMARLGTLCIATVTVLVILAAALQPGEHYLPASICTCTMVCVIAKRISLLSPIFVVVVVWYRKSFN